ncbi:AraC family transcriptional regulator [Nonlabens spongiae]|uniref:AraC family transcriptional regulator n=1 Tax=Nonlabens spongiae TaxID=331648 RepID=A0A1W6MIP6_9FLAO|nr:AraC family transcriptional regulator [Nonlabens spongiae]ARN77329.1 AraC family transcriptional regulator [Nonlabens spongiae]
MKEPVYEKIHPEIGSSIYVEHKREERGTMKPFWHYHPEVELVYVDDGSGKRHVGNHMSYYHNSQLLLIGSMLPHIGFTDRPNHGSELLVQFHPEFLGNEIAKVPELNGIQMLFERAKNGLIFHKETKNTLGARIHKLATVAGFYRLNLLLEILYELSITTDYTVLNASRFTFQSDVQDNSRIENTYKYINRNFKKPIALESIAEEVNMTVPAFCRYFKKVSGKTFTQMVNEYRVVHATKLLSESNSSIADVSFESGFNNFSHFNKVFKQITGKTASAYRKELKLEMAMSERN